MVGLKYCGGCNPNYDRVALVAYLRQRLAGQIVFVRYDQPEAEMILAVEGCPTACADLASFEHLPVFIIKRPSEAEEFIMYVENRLNEQSAE
ncbi:MAG: hypothetical protein M0036_15495 [Desulfobacteraceae bacterium]|nr:hypothetical protein [Desulfobacteraceae bacterium]